ncbi:MAG: ribonuclease H family protein [Lachnospiraceae bacterium]|nr:ribonuclease H family protein [Lachnospiraceae bacterium]
MAAKKNYYAVAAGLTPGIYKTWDECKAQVNGFSGASYKGFATLAEAEEFMKAAGVAVSVQDDKNATTSSIAQDGKKTTTSSIAQDDKNATTSSTAQDDKIPNTYTVPGGVAVFVDGSFNIATKTYGYGCVIINPFHENSDVNSPQGLEGSKSINSPQDLEVAKSINSPQGLEGSKSIKSPQALEGTEDVESDILEILHGSGNDPDYVEMRNVAGEILASEHAIDWAIEKHFQQVDIYYDYEGIEKWANGLWKANKPGTIRYKELVAKKREQIRVVFHKVAAHTGVIYNEMADEAAKQGAGIL